MSLSISKSGGVMHANLCSGNLLARSGHQTATEDYRPRLSAARGWPRLLRSVQRDESGQHSDDLPDQYVAWIVNAEKDARHSDGAGEHD